ncbi:MAG: polysaccharide biosynthesis protein [Spirosomataceae bacterium]
MNRLLLRYSQNFLSRWLVLGIDIVLFGISFFVAILLHFNFKLTNIDSSWALLHLGIVIFLKIFFSLVYKSYAGVIRHTSFEDAVSIVSMEVSALAAMLFVQFFLAYTTETNLFPFSYAIYYIDISALFIDFSISLCALLGVRFLIKAAYEAVVNKESDKNRIIIYGAGFLGQKLKHTLSGDNKRQNQVVCYIDDNKQLANKKIGGVKILSLEAAIAHYFEGEIEIETRPTVIFAIQKISLKERNRLISRLVDLGVTVQVLPPLSEWLNGNLKEQQIKAVKIEDLLNREPIKLRNDLIASETSGRVIMVTGAAGSIGSELVRQLVRFQPLKLILVDQAESGLYDLETELIRIGSEKNQTTPPIQTEIADVVNSYQMEQLFVRYRPQIVYHAAAYKHVPLMERNPYNAIRVNVFGTKTVADLASKYKTERFVMVSTDKAVNPTNVMGATKRLAEMYVHSLNKYSNGSCRYIITRFGNVLGSNGSVIPLFKRQIQAGGPLTVTHPDIIRYFMTIPEACQLVLEAGTMGKGGEIYVFDMGEPVKIVDLAKRMIRLSGLEIDKDISIEFTGLRPGEKLYEELLGDTENTLPTYHEKIMVAKIKAVDYHLLKKSVEKLENSLFGSIPDMVKELKLLVPEFISNNSEFETLDGEKEDVVTEL